MSIVRLALRMPYTVASLVILICLIGALAVLRMRTDIFPVIDIPVVSVIWTYNGMSAQEIQDRILSIHQRQMPAAARKRRLPRGYPQTEPKRVWAAPPRSQ